mmetsp:Transcript_64552/g.114805  ORF Transcript_64552/g.114805 Transcript_64552/m.114805 type:complete len:187 (-) Transcript_64552:540-1100(-)
MLPADIVVAAACMTLKEDGACATLGASAHLSGGAPAMAGTREEVWELMVGMAAGGAFTDAAGDACTDAAGVVLTKLCVVGGAFAGNAKDFGYPPTGGTSEEESGFAATAAPGTRREGAFDTGVVIISEVARPIWLCTCPVAVAFGCGFWITKEVARCAGFCTCCITMLFCACAAATVAEITLESLR